MKNKLALVRFLVPGCLLYVLLVAVCAATNWCSLALPTNWEELSKLTLAVALAFLYNSVRLRERMNESFFKAVNQNLVDKLTAPFAANPMVPRPLQWRHVRPVFYSIIDGDPSLTHQASRAYFNGALWTSAADLRVISLIGILVFVGVLFLGNLFPGLTFPYGKVVGAILVCIFLAGISFPISAAITRRHIEIGNEQVEFILAKYRENLRQQLTQINI